jgi:hypothetical protein
MHFRNQRGLGRACFSLMYVLCSVMLWNVREYYKRRNNSVIANRHGEEVRLFNGIVFYIDCGGIW